MGAHLVDNCHLQNQSGILEIVEQKHHYWAVNVSNAAGVVQVTAYDNRGNQIVQPFQQIISNYIPASSN